MVRLYAPQLGRLQGRVLLTGQEDSLLTLTAPGRDRTVPIATIDSLWLRARGTLTGLQVGAVVGGLGIGIYTVATCGIAETDISVGECAVLGSLLGAAVGAALGGAVGAAAPRWRLRYVAPAKALGIQIRGPRLE